MKCERNKINLARNKHWSRWHDRGLTIIEATPLHKSAKSISLILNDLRMT